MSLVLAPIHDVMYDKILRQDKMTETLLSFAEGKGWSNRLRKEVDDQAPAAAKAPLEEIIDANNIHAWLDHHVKVSEDRFSKVVNGLLAEEPECLLNLTQSLFELGREEQIPEFKLTTEAQEWLFSKLLDGMPCDRAIQVLETNERKVEWEVLQCPHAAFWTNGTENYYILREAWISGSLSQSPFIYSRKGCLHQIERETT